MGHEGMESKLGVCVCMYVCVCVCVYMHMHACVCMSIDRVWMLLHVQAIKEVFDDENEVGLASEAKLNESEKVIVKPNFM